MLALTAPKDVPTGPVAPPKDASRGMWPQSTSGPRTVMQRALQEHPDAVVMGEPILPTGVVGSVLAAGAAAKAAQLAKSIPTRARAGAKFEQVMSAVGDKPVDVGGGVGQSVLRVSELAERGGSMPKAVRDLLKRATDPTKPEPTYREMRDFYSNISALSSKEAQRLSPIVRRELGNMRVALDAALAKTAASGGQEAAYRAAMREYAVASRMREFTKAAAKYGAGVLGAGAAYRMFVD